mmetsp:Transcript_79646/g.157767  ORF Transcript_79646/g.157767 Transcript_79646/m.157767 type:complete len:204 (+) Transcript_79646:944-1555(+)
MARRLVGAHLLGLGAGGQLARIRSWAAPVPSGLKTANRWMKHYLPRLSQPLTLLSATSVQQGEVREQFVFFLFALTSLRVLLQFWQKLQPSQVVHEQRCIRRVTRSIAQAHAPSRFEQPLTKRGAPPVVCGPALIAIAAPPFGPERARVVLLFWQAAQLAEATLPSGAGPLLLGVAQNQRCHDLTALTPGEVPHSLQTVGKPQ